MAAASVLTLPQYDIIYPPTDELTTLANVVTKTITAYQDSNASVYDLLIGASSNIVAQAVNGIILEHNVNDALTLATASGSVVSNYLTVSDRNERVTFTDLNEVGITFVTSDMFIGDARFVQTTNTMTLSMPTLLNGFVVSPATIMESTLEVKLNATIDQNLQVGGDTSMVGRMVTYSGVFTPDLAVYKTGTGTNGAAQVGYSWRVNDKDQLELVKYSFFGTSTEAIAKRVALFGNNVIGSTETSDVTYGASLISGSTNADGGTGGGSYGFASSGGASGFTLSGATSMYTTKSLTIGSATPDDSVDLRVVGTSTLDTVTVTETISSPSYMTTSDARLKDVVAQIDGPSALANIMALVPTMYSWKSDVNKTVHAGFIAQNVAEHLEHATGVRPVGTLEDAIHVDATAIIAYLVAAVKELASKK
jgi:hypothetical protein